MLRVWLHIGMQKTGTSAAQSWLAAHEAALRKAELLYWRPGRGHPASGALVRALAGDPAAAARMIAKIGRARREAGPDLTDILISSEDFSLHPPRLAAPLLAAFEGCDIRVLVWLRRQDLFAEALTKQWIKWNGRQAGDAAALLDRHVRPLLGYDRLLDDWVGSFPQARILPQVYPEHLPGAPPPDSIGALLRVIGADRLIPRDAPAHRANVSPAAALVRHYKTLDGPERIRRANRLLMQRHPDSLGGRGDLFTPAARRQIRDQVAKATPAFAPAGFRTARSCSSRAIRTGPPRRGIRPSPPFAPFMRRIDAHCLRAPEVGKLETVKQDGDG